jgi:hypothetical protein
MGGGALASGLMQSNAAGSAAQAEVNAANQAAQGVQTQYNNASSNLSPYTQAGANALTAGTNFMNNNSYLNGTNAFSAASGGVPYANSQGGFSFNASDLQNTPGYQFTLNQGERAVANQQSAEGLGVSGAQQKAMASYTSGLADSTYNQQFQNQLNAYNSSYSNALNTFNTNYNVASQQYNRYAGLQSQGLQAGSTLGNIGMQAAGMQGNYLTQAGQAQAAGIMGQANAMSGAISGITGGGMLGAMGGSGGSGGGGGLSNLLSMF